MTEYNERPLSAHHNYVINGGLAPGFVVGDPDEAEGFYFLADPVLPGESTSRISARLFDSAGRVLMEIQLNRIRENPGRCRRESGSDGFFLLDQNREVVLEIHTEAFANGYVTRFRGRAFDEKGALRIESKGESIHIHGDFSLTFFSPSDTLCRE